MNEVVFGIQTLHHRRRRRMQGTDESTELWKTPPTMKVWEINCSYIYLIKYTDSILFLAVIAQYTGLSCLCSVCHSMNVYDYAVPGHSFVF